MDSSIRSLLVSALKLVGQDKNPALLQAYTLLRNVAETKPAVDTPESFSQDLYVLCAEIAFQNGMPDMAKECLKMFFMKPPPANQFLCRAYLCQAQLLAPTATLPEQLEKAVVYLLKAISFAKDNPRYHFLVYNASVIYWQFCRPFLKPTFRQFLARSLHQVVKALDDIDDKDFEWRAQLMIALIECNLDAGKRNDATQIANAAATFIKQNVPSLFKQVFGLIVRNQLIDSSKFHKDVKNSPELAVYYQICKLKVSLENNEPKEYYAEIQRILNQMGVAHTDKGKKKSRTLSPSSSNITETESRGRRNSIAPPQENHSRRNSIAPPPENRGRRNSIAPPPDKKDEKLLREVTNVSEMSLTDDLRTDSASRIKAQSQSPKVLKKPPGLLSEKTSDSIRSRSRTPRADTSTGGSAASSKSVSRSASRFDEEEKKPKPKESERSSSTDSKQSGASDSRLPSNTIEMTRSPTKGRRTPTPVSVRKIPADSQEKPYLLLELARLCLDLDFPDLAQDCADHMKTCSVKEQGFYLELEFLGCEIIVKQFSEKQESLHKNIVDTRLQAIKRCEEYIMNAIRLGDPNVIQVGCVTQWNLCLPLLQPNLRHFVRKPLTQIAEALENIQSLLVQIRCQIHTELAKCEEDVEQIEVAMNNLKKALSLDDAKVYQERLEVMLHRLELRSELYQQPERPEDIAGMIIEQARKADSGTMRMKRSLLVKAGEALAPDAFSLVLDSESDTKDATGGKAPLTQIKKLSNKARQFTKCVKKAVGHLQRLGDENDRERARLWGDLAKTARKQEVWDVCRVAARFCLLYDDSRWKVIPAPPKTETPKPIKTLDSNLETAQSTTVDRQGTQLTTKDGGSRPSSPSQLTSLYDQDLIRMLAEVNFIQGEAVVHLLRTEGIQLNDMPIPPVDKSKHPKGYVAKKPEEDPDWIEYCDWIKSLSEQATNSFLRGLALGVELEEAWLVCCATTYVWNYNNHVLTQLRHREIIEPLTTVFDGLKKVGHANETMSLVNVCNALSYALMKPWIPDLKKESTPSTTPAPGDSPTPKKGKVDPKAKNSKTSLITIPSEAMPDLKKAIEVCEYAMEVTNGTNPQDVVGMVIRLPILQTWVYAKQLANQNINKNFGTDEEPFTEGQKAMSRAIVAVEMLKLNKNGIFDFKDATTTVDAANMIEACKWTDKFVELQLWSQMTFLAYDQKQHSLVIRCSKKALRFASVGTQPKNRKMEPHRYMVEQEMLSYASGLLGQSLTDNMGGKNSVRREALSAFLNSAKFASNANNYEMVMTAARHYWNACVPLVSQPIERELLREPIRIILQCITVTAESIKKKEEKEDDESKGDSESQTGAEVAEEKEKSVGGIGAVEDDLTLRAALYGVLFQSYTDKGEWEFGLKAMDQAITDMPRTKHRLLIFKHRVMTKAKLGRSVAMDIQKFKTELRYIKEGRTRKRKDESEDYVAHMWRRVALSSKEIAEQLLSYQNAVEALNSQSSEWLKVELLIEFGQWMYSKEFPLQDCVDQIEWAVDMMLNMQADIDAKREQALIELRAAQEAAEAKKAAGKGGKNAKKGGPPPKAKPPSAKKEPIKPKETKEKKGEGEDGDPDAEDIIPVAKEAIIGVEPANPNLKLQDLTDIKVLDGLLRAHVLLAELVGRGSPQYADYLLMAHAYLLKMWQTTVTVSGPTMKEILKNPPAAPEEKGKGSAKKKDKGEAKAPVKEKPKRKGPLDTLPHSAEEWAQYDVPDEVIEAFNHEMMIETGINKHTLLKPMLTLHYTDSLSKQLRDLGYNHLSLPVLAFQDLLSRDLLASDSLKFLVHTKAMEVCQELNLTNGYSFHEKQCGPMVINENDQAKSRDEIAFWKEKQAQVIKEEMRVKETIAKLAAETNKTRKELPVSKQNTVITDTQGEPKVESHLGKVLGAVQFRDVWTDIAEILIRQGHYQGAREFLNEAHMAAVSFDDIPLQAKVLYQLALLAFEEAQYGQAINFCQNAQKINHGDEMFWYETTDLMVQATLNDYENRNAKRTARGVLVYSLNQFMALNEERPNRSSSLGFIISILIARLAKTQWSIIQEEHPDINHPKVMKQVHEICIKYDTATCRLNDLGYKREALSIMKEHASVLLTMARQSLEKEIIHTYYLQAMMVLKEGVTTGEDVLHDVQTLSPLQEIRGMSLPVQREVADMKLTMGEVMLEIFRIHAKEMRYKQMDDVRKGSVLKMVEDFIRTTPDYTHMEKDWVETVKLVVEDAVMKFLDAHNMASNIPRMKAKALCGVGQCLRALSLHQSADAPTHWIVHELELTKLTNIEEEGDEDNSEDIDKHSRQFLKYAKQIRDTKMADDGSKQFLVQATECLVQSLNISLSKKYVDIAAVCAQELVDCFGQYDPSVTSSFLALFQSCCASLKMEELLMKAQLDPIESKLAALVQQRKNLLQRDVTYNMSSSTVMSTVQAALESDWQAWKKMEIIPNHLDMLKEFPGNFNFIVLQHSPDKTFLYGAVLDKPKGSVGGGGEKKGNPKQGAPGLTKAKVFGMETSPEELEALLNKCREHKQNVQQLLVKQEYQRSQAAMRQKMLQNLDDSLKGQKSKTLVDESEKEERRLQDEFRDLVMALEMYLKPITSQIDGFLVHTPLSPSISTTDKPGKEPKEPPPLPQEYAIILADPHLLELPLEALRLFQSESIVSLSRDFSLQMFYHRFHQELLPGNVTGPRKGEAPKKGDNPKGAGHAAKGEDPAAAAKKAAKAKGGDQPFSRLPGLRDASKKMAKIIPLNRPGNPWNMLVDTMNFRYIVDPYLDCAETEENKPIEVFNSIIETYEQQFTPRWLGVMGDEHTPSVGEWEIYLIENSSFIFYGMEKLTSYLPPAKLSALNIPECMIIYLLDMAQTTKSFTRQSKIDVLKSSYTLALEKPVETAMLTSLTGVKCIIGNQWNCTLAENSHKLNTNMKDMLEAGMSTGEATRLLFTPYRRKIPMGEEGEEETKAENEEAKSQRSEAEGSITDRSQGSEKTTTTTTVHEYRENIDLQRSWYNLVCYGLPNLIVAQL